MKHPPESPAGKLERQAYIVQRPSGWVIMDKSGLFFLKADGNVASSPDYWPGRAQAREFHKTWAGVTAPKKRGPKKDGPAQERDRRLKFQRQLSVLMFLWQQYPGAATIETTLRAVNQQLGLQSLPRNYRRDLDFLTRIGYAVRLGSAYTAVSSYARWWSHDFEHLEDVPCKINGHAPPAESHEPPPAESVSAPAVK